MTDHGVPIPPPPRPIEYRDLDDRGWLLSVLGGIALVVLGVWLLTNLFESVTVLALLVGVSLIAGGFTEAALGSEEGIGWPGYVAGALLVVAGVVVLVWPDITLWALAVLAGAGLVAAGALRVLTALTGPDRSDRAVHVAIGAAGIVLGLIVLAWPGATLVVLAIVIGLRAIATGLVAIGLGWQLHRLAS